ncbi:MAG: hypothetical protein V1740_05920 [Candidatus Woesearchaeota archaeon]
MVLHHIFTESDLRNFCPYCKSDISENEWKSLFHAQIHYKESECTCGKSLKIRVPFIGTGHDSWDGKQTWKRDVLEIRKDPKTKMKTLDTQIKVMECMDKAHK